MYASWLEDEGPRYTPTMRHHSFFLVMVFLCGCGPAASPVGGASGGGESADGVVLLENGSLDEGDQQVGQAYVDHYEVEVEPGVALTVELTSDEFDTFLEVTPPGSAPMVNDDFHGDRTRSLVELVASAAGVVKISVRSYGAGATGAYRLVVSQPQEEASPEVFSLVSGQSAVGTFGPGDAEHEGSRLDVFSVEVPSGQPHELIASAETGPPSLVIIDPQGRAVRSEGGRARLTEGGIHRVQVVAPAASEQPLRYQLAFMPATAESNVGAPDPALAREHHQPASGVAAAMTAINIGERREGAIEASDTRLPTQESADLYSFTATAGQALTVEMESAALDSYVMVVGPNGQLWENDDAEGLNSRLNFTAAATGTHRLLATTYRAGMTGAYELKLFAASRAPSGVAAGSSQRWNTQRGALASGDRQLQSGEFVDTFPLDLPAGAHVRLEANSTAFDTYLIVRSPSGESEQNDDQQSGNTNAALDLVASAAGRYEVAVTSYQAGEVGDYELRISGAEAGSAATTPTATTATTPTTPTGTNTAATATTPATSATAGEAVRGALASGDTQLESGEFVDRYSMNFTPGEAVQLRLNSSDFDTYLIARTPAGEQLDNDDLVSGNLNSGLDIAAAEPGVYTVMVTSYEPGQTGSYELLSGNDLPGPRPSGTPTGGSGNVYGIFAGISDYPGGGDLPECANDAIKLAQSLREAEHMPEANQIVLTDGQVTNAALTQAFQQMATRVQPNDTFIFFYSGHGGQQRGSQDPREIDGIDETLVLYDGPMVDDRMAEMFDSIQGLGLIALDACFSGGFAKDVITRPGRMGLFSSEEDVLSSVAGQFQAGGYLSHFLRTGIAGEADTAPRDGLLTAGELSHYLVRQFGTHVRDVRVENAWQHLVVDRGAVGTSSVLFRSE